MPQPSSLHDSHSPMSYRSLRECVDDLERHRPARAHRVAGRRPPRGRGDPPPRLRRRRAGGVLRQRHGLPVPDGQQPVRHDGAHAVDVPRRARRRSSGWSQLEGESASGAAAAVAVLAGAARRPLHAAEVTSASGPVLAEQTTRQRAAAAAELAARRRAVRHAAAGLHRRRPRAGAAALEPRHVPRAARRQPVRSATAKSACTTRFTAASASITRRRCARASRSA